MKCGLPYTAFPLDVVLPDDQWRLVSGREDGGGVMCADCIVMEGAKLPGVTVAKLTFETSVERDETQNKLERLEKENKRLKQRLSLYKQTPQEWSKDSAELIVRAAYEHCAISIGRAAELLGCSYMEIQEKEWIQDKCGLEIERLKNELKKYEN